MRRATSSEPTAGQGQPDDELAGVTELLDDAIAELDRGEARPDSADRRRLLEADLDKVPPVKSMS